jgi:hypothetical protein
LLSILIIFAYLALIIGLHCVVPGWVKVTNKHFHYAHGQSASRFKLEEIESARLVICSPRHIRLWLTFKGKTRKYTVAPTADLSLLTDLIESIRVDDKRSQFKAARR